MSRSEKFVIWN